MGTAHGLSVLFRRMILADNASRYFLPFGGALAAAAGAAGAAFPALASGAAAGAAAAAGRGGRSSAATSGGAIVAIVKSRSRWVGLQLPAKELR